MVSTLDTLSALLWHSDTPMGIAQVSQGSWKKGKTAGEEGRGGWLGREDGCRGGEDGWGG